MSRLNNIHSKNNYLEEKVPKVTVIIVNWNRKNYLTLCLQSLRKQTYRDFEVLVVDNGSTDGSVSVVRSMFPEVRVIPLDRNYGFAAANNIGLNMARGDYIALLNNDAQATPNWLEELVRAIEAHPEVGFCASRILLLEYPNLVDACGDFYTRDGFAGKRGHLNHSFMYEHYEYVFGACGAAVLYRKKMLEEIGFFDEDFFLAHEDTDLSFRAQLAGYKCLYVPTAVVYHHLSATIGRDSDMYIYYGHRNIEYVFLKNMPTCLLYKSLPAHLLMNIFLLIFYLTRGQACPFLRAKVDVIRNLPLMLRKRKVVQKYRKSSLSYISSLLEESWFKQALRKKVSNWLKILYE